MAGRAQRPDELEHRDVAASGVRRGEHPLYSETARMYFDDQLSKVEIAARLGISRFRVARLIGQALALGLVRIEYAADDAVDHRLGQAIEQRFGVRLCVVARRTNADLTDGVARLGALGASVVADLIGPEETIGITWGAATASVAARMPFRDAPSIRVVQLSGGSGRVLGPEAAPEVARALAERLGATLHALHAPAFVRTAELRKQLLREPDVHATSRLWNAVTLAVVGIGALDARPRGSGSLLLSRVLDGPTRRHLQDAGAVAEMMLSPIDASGRLVASQVVPVAISIDQLRRTPRTVAIAGGADKAKAIVAALRTGAVDILITDDTAAAGVLA